MANIDATPAAMERGRLRSAGSRTKNTTACARVAAAAWWALAGLASASFGVQAQEADFAPRAPDEDGLAVSAHIGTHLALYYLIPIPGVSVDVIVDSGRLPVWGQVQLSGHIHGIAMGSVRLGGGGRRGFGGYALCEKVVGVDDSIKGCGFGGRLARDRTTFSLDVTGGEYTGGDGGGYLKLNFAVHYRLGRLR